MADAGAVVTLVVVSPHLDDAVLCAGAGMAAARSRGIDVLVVTVFTAGAAGTALSPFARAFHRQCGLGDEAVVTRRHEDAVATAALDVGCRWLDVQDALYRAGHRGPRYVSDETLFGPPDRADEHLETAVRAGLRSCIGAEDTVVLPLSVGGHVDHVLARRWGEVEAAEAGARRVGYYEESLYEDQHGARAWSGVATAGLERLRHVVPAALLAAKERAVGAYASQLTMLGVGPDRPAARARFVARLGVEGYWCADGVSPFVP